MDKEEEERKRKRREYINDYRKRCSQEVKDRKKEREKAYRSTPEYKERQKEYRKVYNQLPESKAKRSARRKSLDNAKKRREYQEQQRKCPKYRLRQSVSVLIRMAIKNAGGSKDGGRTFEHLSYTPQQLAAHIEGLFTNDMTWDNYGIYWHLDHIIPQAALPYDSLTHSNFAKCWALENLQPLEAGENMSKGSLHEGKRHYYEHSGQKKS